MRYLHFPHRRDFNQDCIDCELTRCRVIKFLTEWLNRGVVQVVWLEKELKRTEIKYFLETSRDAFPVFQQSI